MQDFEDQTLPLGAIADALGMATSTISSDVTVAFTANADTLGQGLDALTKALQATKSYAVTDPKTGKEVRIDNDLMDADMVTLARSLVPGQIEER